MPARRPSPSLATAVEAAERPPRASLGRGGQEDNRTASGAGAAVFDHKLMMAESDVLASIQVFKKTFTGFGLRAEFALRGKPWHAGNKLIMWHGWSDQFIMPQGKHRIAGST